MKTIKISIDLPDALQILSFLAACIEMMPEPETAEELLRMNHIRKFNDSFNNQLIDQVSKEDLVTAIEQTKQDFPR